MSEKGKNIPDFDNWDGVTHFMADALKSNETLATEVIKDSERKVVHIQKSAKHWFIAFLITLGILFATNAFWIYTFQSYDFVSQDGSGINSINTGHQEDIDYGTTSKIEERQE